MLSYEQLKNKAININSDIKASRRRLNKSKDEMEDKKEELDNLEESKDIQSEAVEVLKELVDEMSKEHIEQVEDMLTYGLQTIFYDKNYTVKIKIEEKNNYKSADMFLIKKEGDKIIKTNFDDGLGGGVRVVTGFMLQVFYIQYFDLNRIIFLDEAFSELSEKYVEGLIEFIRKISDNKGFKIVLISHNNRVIPYADKVYRVESGEVDYIEKEDKEWENLVEGDEDG